MQKSYWHPTWIEIDVEQFRKNIAAVRALIGKTLYCLPVKANAYGHGLLPIAKIAAQEGVDYLAVAHATEGVALREEGISLPILVLGAIHERQVKDLLDHNLEISVSSRLKADLIRQGCQTAKKRCRIHLEIDTGMHRTGMRPETAVQLYQELSEDPCFEIVGLYSHFALADGYGKGQIEAFKAACQKIGQKATQPLICHIGNSKGVIVFPEAHLDMVRPALLTFGYGGIKQAAPCFSLKSTVSYFKVVEQGKGIGYDHTFYTEKKSRIVTVPIGYGDGYRRDLSNRARVLIRGKSYPIVGTICMDQFMVDVGEDPVFVGDEVVLIGKQGKEEIALQEIAALCHTIPYEILCGLNERVPRIYID